MKLAARNIGWVWDHAQAIGARKRGLAKDLVTVGEVVEALGFTRNTVKKYFDMLEEQGALRKIVVSRNLIVYRVMREVVSHA